MIRLHKGPIPESLGKNGAKWKAELMERVEQGAEIPDSMWNRYNQPDVKQQIVTDAYSKCAYCESKIAHVTFGDIDHLRPKKRFPTTTYEWSNLLLACPRCNNKKRDNYNEVVPPVNPVTEDPAAFLIAYGDQIWPQPGQDRGAETIALVELNRPELIERRRRRCEQIRHVAEAIVRMTGEAAKAALIEQLRQELGDDHEYAFVSRAAAQALGL